NQSDPWDYRNKRHRYRYEMGVDNRVRAARISRDARPPVSSKSGKHGVLRTSNFLVGCFQKGEKEYLNLFFSSVLHALLLSRFPSTPHVWTRLRKASADLPPSGGPPFAAPVDIQ